MTVTAQIAKPGIWLQPPVGCRVTSRLSEATLHLRVGSLNPVKEEPALLIN